MADPIDTAAAALGLNENDKATALNEYLSNGGVNLDPAVTAWCAAFVNATLAQSGMQGTGSNLARSYLEWGQPVDKPQRGDVAVFSRGDPNGPYGHVGFFEGYNADGSIRVLGGNQGDAVSVSSYGADQLLGFRRGEGMGGGPQNALGIQPQMAGAVPPNALSASPTLQDFGFQNYQNDPNGFKLKPYNALARQG
jgi:uncharacterized protein (TIGR02594 family)